MSLALIFVSNSVNRDTMPPPSSYWNLQVPLISFIFCHFPKVSPSRLCARILILLYASSPQPSPSFPPILSLPAFPPLLSGFLVPWPTKNSLAPHPEGLSSLPPSTETVAPLWEQALCGPFKWKVLIAHFPHSPGPGKPWYSSNSPLLLPKHNLFSTNKYIPFRESASPHAFSLLPQLILSQIPSPSEISFHHTFQIPCDSLPASSTHRTCLSYLGFGWPCFDMEIRRQAFSLLG